MGGCQVRCFWTQRSYALGTFTDLAGATVGGCRWWRAEADSVGVVQWVEATKSREVKRDRPDGRCSAFVVGGENWWWSEELLGGGWLWWWVGGGEGIWEREGQEHLWEGGK